MNTGVVVLGGHIQSLGILRILGRKGIPGIIIDKTRKNIARHSRYCSAFYLVQDADLAEFLRNMGETHQYDKWVIFPSNDFHVRVLSENKEELGNYFTISMDSWDVIKVFYNKINAYKLAKRLDIPIAATFFPESEKGLENITIEFPCIIKPAVMHDFYRQTKRKVFICRDLEELKENYRKAVKLIPANEVIVQEIIKGPGKNQFSAAFLFLNEQTYVSLTACRMRQHPLDFGHATTYAETVDVPLLREYGEKILKAANYNGLCEVEFKLDERDNQYKFLEVNTRTWKWHTLANKANTPFLSQYFKYLTGSDIQPIDGFSKASFSHLLTDFPMQLKLLFKGYDYWRRKIHPVEHAVFDTHDIKPWLWEKVYLPFLIGSR